MFRKDLSNLIAERRRNCDCAFFPFVHIPADWINRQYSISLNRLEVYVYFAYVSPRVTVLKGYRPSWQSLSLFSAKYFLIEL